VPLACLQNNVSACGTKISNVAQTKHKNKNWC